MPYSVVFFFGRVYTGLIKRSFYHFGKNSIVKPFLNSSNNQHISIGNNVNIGSFCRLTVSTEFAGVRYETDHHVRLRIGDNVCLGGSTFISANNLVEIGNDVMMSEDVFITDHDHGFDDMTRSVSQQPLTQGGHVTIGDNVFLGARCSVLKNVTIGERSVVAANAVVTKNVPPYSIVAGNPAKLIKTYDFHARSWVRV